MYSGVLLLDKPTGWTSHQLVQKIRKTFGQKKVGHCGTLDPMATGLMVLVLGKACSLSSFLTCGDKSYQAQIQLGLETDTLDRDGNVLKQSEVHLCPKIIQETLRQNLGVQSLRIPIFSAKKVGGKKLYEYARKGEKVPYIEKEMKFYDLKIDLCSFNQVVCQISCTKGSFIRAWAHKIGENLGVGACLTKLRRLSSYPYLLSQVQNLPLEELKEQIQVHQKLSYWIPYEEAYLQVQKIENELVQHI